MDDNRNVIESADPDVNHYNDTIIDFKSYTSETFCGNINNKVLLIFYIRMSVVF